MDGRAALLPEIPPDLVVEIDDRRKAAWDLRHQRLERGRNDQSGVGGQSGRAASTRPVRSSLNASNFVARDARGL